MVQNESLPSQLLPQKTLNSINANCQNSMVFFLFFSSLPPFTNDISCKQDALIRVEHDCAMMKELPIL